MSPDQKEKYVHIALDKALRLEKLINEFFEITRYNLQQIVLEKETIEADISQKPRTGRDVLKEREKVTVTFSKHGKTIPKQRLESIFEKFFRLDEARTTDSGGSR